jgi:uncharacterized protein YndB with AHSA1/START domain
VNRSAVHDTFSYDRHFAVAPAKVYRAFADKAAKEQWFNGPPGAKSEGGLFEFREGGRETNRTLAEGTWWGFSAVYADLVPDERIVYTYEMDRDGQRTSVSVVTIELRAAGDGTDLTLTECGVYLDGIDRPADRRDGTQMLLAALTAHLTA